MAQRDLAFGLRQLYRRTFRVNNPETRGLRLLRDWLSRRQREQFDSEGYFDVIGCDTGGKVPRSHWHHDERERA